MAVRSHAWMETVRKSDAVMLCRRTMSRCFRLVSSSTPVTKTQRSAQVAGAKARRRSNRWLTSVHETRPVLRVNNVQGQPRQASSLVAEIETQSWLRSDTSGSQSDLAREAPGRCVLEIGVCLACPVPPGCRRVIFVLSRGLRRSHSYFRVLRAWLS